MVHTPSEGENQGKFDGDEYTSAQAESNGAEEKSRGQRSLVGIGAAVDL